MRAIDLTLQADAFVCQLSTNDATQDLPLGSVSSSRDPSAFDTQTVAGAMEYIIAYARTTWKAPVFFLTGTRYDSSRYGAMVDLLLQIQQKWGIGVIDLWNNPAMNAISNGERALYMVDEIHPTRAGYREWWTPVIEPYLYDHLVD
jgi:lysophospholipase L1-like esterase